jgi:hypothetical protein
VGDVHIVIWRLPTLFRILYPLSEIGPETIAIEKRASKAILYLIGGQTIKLTSDQTTVLRAYQDLGKKIWQFP